MSYLYTMISHRKATVSNRKVWRLQSTGMLEEDQKGHWYQEAEPKGRAPVAEGSQSHSRRGGFHENCPNASTAHTAGGRPRALHNRPLNPDSGQSPCCTYGVFRVSYDRIKGFSSLHGGMDEHPASQLHRAGRGDEGPCQKASHWAQAVIKGSVNLVGISKTLIR